MTNYQQAKEHLNSIAGIAVMNFKNDKPAVRQCINDSIDNISAMYDLTYYQRDLLSNYACTLHPKN